jgi:hypothetical protein
MADHLMIITWDCHQENAMEHVLSKAILERKCMEFKFLLPFFFQIPMFFTSFSDFTPGTSTKNKKLLCLPPAERCVPPQQSFERDFKLAGAVKKNGCPRVGLSAWNFRGIHKGSFTRIRIRGI